MKEKIIKYWNNLSGSGKVLAVGWVFVVVIIILSAMFGGCETP